MGTEKSRTRAINIVHYNDSEFPLKVLLQTQDEKDKDMMIKFEKMYGNIFGESTLFTLVQFLRRDSGMQFKMYNSDNYSKLVDHLIKNFPFLGTFSSPFNKFCDEILKFCLAYDV